MPLMTMVGVGDGNPPNVDDGSSETSSKGQPNGFSHSTTTCKWGPQGPYNLKKNKSW
jgi:hypothetical protein